MSRKFGVSITDELAEKVEKPLEYGDSRSERVRDLMRLGLAVEEEFARHEMVFDDVEEMEEAIQDCISHRYG